MKKFLSKTTKILMPISLIAMILAFSNTQQAFSQPADGIYFKLVLAAEDAVGNTDTVVFYVKEGATNGIDTELGEVNLYGLSPQGDLDLRIIQRTTVNCACAGQYDYGQPMYQRYGWLCPTNLNPDGYDPCDFGNAMLVYSSAENIDLKVDYRYDSTINIQKKNFIFPDHLYSCVIKVYAKHYPVSIRYNWYGGLLPTRQLYNEEDGMPTGWSGWSECIDMGWNQMHIEFSCNELIAFGVEPFVSIEDFTEQPPLYPNPATDFIIIEDGRFGETFTVMNVEGKVLKTVTVEYYPYSLDVRELQRGTYFLKNREGTIIYSFIKQ